MNSSLLRFLAVTACIPLAAWADEIRLNLMDSPDRVGTYYIADKENSGTVTGPQQGQILHIDEKGWPIHVGDWAAQDGPGYMVKYFLLFHLPQAEGKKLTRATLRLYLTQIRHDATENPLPQALLVHAEDWQDTRWSADSEFHGLQALHFADQEAFSNSVPLCGPDSKPGFIDIDVTGMIESDYRRDPEPVTAFRLEMADHETLDSTDGLGNSYNFWGPMPQTQDRLPTLVLSFE
ncbi:MAG: hypothetical protein D4R65_02170 [Verrucomicrobiaceae bacterium]|nr:MAG: hypothetical protein D4R65_02170 [Verrucomicrobiaceae bacterium]